MKVRTACRLGVLTALLWLVLALSAQAEVGWYTQTSPVSTNLKSVDFVDESYGWICGIGGVILATTDGGATWTPQNSGTTLNLLDVSFLDRNLGFAVGSQEIILRTTDGGSSWQTVHAGDMYARAINAVDVYDAQNIWAVGSAPNWGGDTPGLVYVSTDGGTTWGLGDLVVADSDCVIYDVSVASPTTGYFALVANWGEQSSPVGLAAKTTDSGASFGLLLGTPNGESCSGVQFLSPSVGYAVFPYPWSGGCVSKTQDGGATWASRVVGQGVAHISFVDEFHGWAVGSPGLISRTQDGGASWIAQASGTTANLAAVDFVNYSVGAAVGPSGLILHTVTGGDQGAGVLPAGTSDQAIRLLASTPNPFSDGVQVRYSLRDHSPVDLAVYDIHGRRIRDLQPGPSGPGEQVVAWDGKDMSGRIASPGVYYVRLAALGEVRRQQVTLIR